MKPNILITAFLALSAIAAQAQSSLTPPAGPPAETSHTLNEVYDKAATIEGQSTSQGTKIDSIQTQITNLGARRPLIAGAPGVTISANGTITISSPGSYYLTNNKLISSTGAHGIAVFARDVTIDLNGFALQCGSGTGGSAIFLDSVAGARQVRICNGFIRGGSTWSGTTFTSAGWTNGISGAAVDVSISDVTIDGVRTHGIDSANATVTNCVVSECGGVGIKATIVDKCRATKCLGHGIVGSRLVDRSEGESVGPVNPTGTDPGGIYASGATVTNSIGVAQTGEGITGDRVSHSSGTSVSGTGIEALGLGVDHCVGISTSAPGILASAASNSRGATTSGSWGLRAPLASFCIGTHSGGGIAVSADNAIGCAVSGSGTIDSPKKNLGTP